MPRVLFGLVRVAAATVESTLRVSVIADVIALILMCGCYHTPDYSTADFKCDAEHACPPGQACISGRCNPGGVPPVSVACGGAICSADQVCCADARGTATCIAPGADCEGSAASCDGVEDCPGGACCLTPLGAQVACGEVDCNDQVCRENADCLLPSAPICCFNVGLPSEPWGHCLSSCP